MNNKIKTKPWDRGFEAGYIELFGVRDIFNKPIESEKVICNHRKQCKEKLHCGGAKPHRPSDCEPCPFHSEAKCIPYKESIK